MPSPRHPEEEHGDLEKTLAAWVSFNKAMIEFNKKNAEAEKKYAQVPPINRRNPMQGLDKRNRAISASYKVFAKAYRDFAGKVKALGADRGVDTDLAEWLVDEGDTLHRLGDSYQELATSILAQSDEGDFDEAKVLIFKEALNDLRTEYDAHRLNLSRMFNKPFPTVEDTEKDLKKAVAKNDPPPKGKKADRQDRSVRTPIHRSGRHRAEVNSRSQPGPAPGSKHDSGQHSRSSLDGSTRRSADSAPGARRISGSEMRSQRSPSRPTLKLRSRPATVKRENPKRSWAASACGSPAITAETP